VYSTQGRPFVVSKVLHWFEDQLPPDMFARVHRSHLVNRQFINTVHHATVHMALELHNGDRIPVSRRKKGAVG
jgi:DNA-binding LytR/AlgR family response regulator